MNTADFSTRRYELSVIAGMNQRYHQHEAYKQWWRDTAAKIVTAVFAVLGLSLAIVSAFSSSALVDGAGISVSLVAAIAAVFLNVVPYGTWEKDHVDCFRRWTDIREDVDSLEFEITDGSEPTKEAIARLRELEAKAHRICGSETLANQKLLDACQVAEEHSRGCGPCNAPAQVAIGSH
jgi:hypothetical protein